MVVTEKYIEFLMDKIDMVENGKSCPLELATEIKHLQKVLDESFKQIKEIVMDDLGDEPVTVNGFKIEKRSGRKIWKFDHIEKYGQIKSEMKSKLKAIEDGAKLAYNNNLKGHGQMVVDSETGEIIEPASLTYTPETLAFIQVKK